MKPLYKYEYCSDNVYGHVIKLLSDLKPSQGVHLDIACGYAAIKQPIVDQFKMEYIGIDSNQQTIFDLQESGIEAYQYEFGDLCQDYVQIKTILKDRKVSSITILDALEHMPHPENLLNTIHRVALEYNAPLIISVPNVAHRDISFKLFSGDLDYTDTGLLDRTHVSLFTEKRLAMVMREYGFEETHSYDFIMEKSDQHFPQDHIFLEENSLVHTYLDWLKDLVDPTANINQFVRAYLPKEKQSTMNQKEVAHPFLTVVTRTQGKRPEALRETLLCLTAQTCMDFEVLVLGHKLTPESRKEVTQIIDETPSWIRDKIRFIKVDTGTRTTPLNVGFDQAKGAYIAILDDDDLVFDNWVESFYQLSKQHSGTILHAYAVTQDWQTLALPNQIEALQACGTPDNIYCRDFDPVGQLNVNYCPTMSLAFPAYAFHKFNIHFDETLTTTEDWDFLMRTSFICGVSDIATPTSIYRLWNNAENSQSLHDKKEWRKNHRIIHGKFNDTPIVLPKGSLDSLLEISQKTNIARLYINEGMGCSEGNTLKVNNESSLPDFCYLYTDLDQYDTVTEFRWDPTDETNIVVEDLTIEMTTQDNKVSIIYFDNIQKGNYDKINDKLIFTEVDPMIYIPIPNNQKIKQIKITGLIEFGISRELTKKIENNQLRALLYIDDGTGYCEKMTVRNPNQAQLSKFCYRYTNFEKFDSIKNLRWDPSEQSDIVIQKFNAQITFRNNQTLNLTYKNIHGNGFKVHDKLIFIKSDPHIYLPISHQAQIQELVITGKVTFGISDELIDKIIPGAHYAKNQHSAIYNILKKVYCKLFR